MAWWVIGQWGCNRLANVVANASEKWLNGECFILLIISGGLLWIIDEAECNGATAGGRVGASPGGSQEAERDGEWPGSKYWQWNVSLLPPPLSNKPHFSEFPLLPNNANYESTNELVYRSCHSPMNSFLVIESPIWRTKFSIHELW